MDSKIRRAADGIGASETLATIEFMLRLPKTIFVSPALCPQEAAAWGDCRAGGVH